MSLDKTLTKKECIEKTCQFIIDDFYPEYTTSYAVYRYLRGIFTGLYAMDIITVHDDHKIIDILNMYENRSILELMKEIQALF